MFGAAEAYVLSLAQSVPLETFAFLASFIEEVVAPIPSPAVMVTTGSLASIQGYGFLGLGVLALIAALGKTVGAVIVYGVVAKMEDVVLTKFGRILKVTTDDIETLRKKLTGTPRDYFLLIGFRAFPFFPSSLISIGCGFIHVPIRLYIVATFLGTIIRDSFYLYFGYAGLSILGSFIQGSSSAESYIQIAVVILIGLAFGYIYIKRSQKKA